MNKVQVVSIAIRPDGSYHTLSSVIGMTEEPDWNEDKYISYRSSLAPDVVIVEEVTLIQ